jgi:molybdenum cofactor guanylyltransferase
MGRDKSGIVVHGKPQREYLLDELNAVCKRSFISSKHDAPGVIVDSFNIDSPLNGIISAFHYAPGVAWLAVAVDMPYVDRKVLSMLIDARNPGKLATCFYNKETNLPEPLLTIWEPASLEPLRKFAEAGRISPRDFLSQHSVHLLEPPDPKVFYNMNTPGDIV